MQRVGFRAPGPGGTNRGVPRRAPRGVAGDARGAQPARMAQLQLVPPRRRHPLRLLRDAGVAGAGPGRDGLGGGQHPLAGSDGRVLRQRRVLPTPSWRNSPRCSTSTEFDHPSGSCCPAHSGSCCTAQRFPSGSVKKTKRPHGKSEISLTSTPFPASWSRAAARRRPRPVAARGPTRVELR